MLFFLLRRPFLARFGADPRRTFAAGSAPAAGAKPDPPGPRPPPAPRASDGGTKKKLALFPGPGSRTGKAARRLGNSPGTTSHLLQLGRAIILSSSLSRPMAIKLLLRFWVRTPPQKQSVPHCTPTRSSTHTFATRRLAYSSPSLAPRAPRAR